MHDLTPWRSLFGGVLIGLAATLLLFGTGRVAGVSGMLAGAAFGARDERKWRGAFLLGLFGVGLIAGVWLPDLVPPAPRSLVFLLLAGVLVGAGTELGSGCTSGHGVCGISRGSVRSLLATALFITSGVLTVFVTRLLGAAP